MTSRDWEQAYEHLLSDNVIDSNGENSTGADRRKHPRFTINSVTVTARVEVSTEHIINASAGGIAFNCAFSFMAQTLIQLSFDKILTLDATVVSCERNELKLDLQYTVQCKFADEGDGKQLLVMILDMSELGNMSST